jgi:urea transporter
MHSPALARLNGRPKSLLHLSRSWLLGTLASLGQIYFQSSALSGVTLLLCLYLSGPALALGALLAIMAANLTARASGFPAGLRQQGLHGFNAALAGIGLCSSYQFNPALLVWLVAAGILSCGLSQLFLRWSNLPALSLPFILVMWLAAALDQASGLQALSSPATSNCSGMPLSYAFCAIGKIAFIDTIALGMLIFAVLTRHQWHLGAWALLGAILAWASLMLGDSLWPHSQIALQASGMGANCMLVALGLSVYQRAWPMRLLGFVLCLLLCQLFGRLGLPYFTLAFVLASWTILVLTVAPKQPATQQ